jgi:valyl-tRNA synthetase
VEGITALEAADPNLTLVYVCLLEDPKDPGLLAFFEKYGLVQDPDVLDTWFSSALWPHSTLGWPEHTPELAKWYPTSVLLTGRDIITLWVARMVMTGLYNIGTVPFHHVAINPTILDEYGRRMSKSAGNGVDPVDIIESHGADALRFTLATMATETQDARMPVKIVCPKCQTLIANPESNKVLTVTCPKCKTEVTRPLGVSKGSPQAPLGRMTSEKFDFGRNFCNKLWNAARFVISNIESVPPEPADESKWSIIDRWIVSRFNRTVDEANKALTAYRFDAYARACYDFFWRDFCDWYVEATKPAMKDSARAGQTANVLAAVLEGSLRLLHPVVPFITETIWWRLCEARPERGLPGRIMGCTSKRLILAAWPQVGDFSQAAEHVFPKLQEVVVAIRNVRNDYKVDAKKPVIVSIKCPGEDATMRVKESREMIELLATCKFATIAAELTPPANSVRVPAAAAEVYVEGLVDAEAEKQRDTKRRDELTKLVATLNGRLGNAGYIAKAPPQLVEQTKKQLAEAEAELAKLG